MEKSNQALLDDCCTADVMDVDWRDNFFASLSEDNQNEVKFCKSRIDSSLVEKILSVQQEKLNVLAICLEKETTLVADGVERDIPSLISKAEMKKKVFFLNFNDDSLEADTIKYDL